MAINGLVGFLVDPDPKKRYVISPVMVADMLALAGPTLKVRAPLAAAVDNSFPTVLYRQALDTYHAAGVPVVGVVAQEFDRVMLNAPLGGPGVDPTINPAIQEYTLRLHGVCRQLVPHGLHEVWLYNEPNISDQPAIGIVPGTHGTKSTALNPEVFGSLLYQGARRAKAAGITRVYAGALTALEQFHTNPDGDWIAGYLDKALGYLASHGKHDLAVDVVSANMEGVVDAAYAAHVSRAIRGVFARYGYTVQTACGEWSWPNGSAVDPVTAASTYAALTAAFDEVYFFQYPLATPHSPRGYGARDWVVVDQSFYPSGDLPPWHPILHALFGTTP